MSGHDLNQGKQPEYLKDSFCQDYVARIKKKRPTGGIPREDQVDHLWQRILKIYFEHQTSAALFDVQREAYATEQSQKRSDISVVNRRGEPAGAHKVIWFEAKRPKGTEPSRETIPNENDWEEVRGQIRGYMVTARAADGDVQRMYGVTAVGMYARMFQLPRHSDRLQAVDDGRTFHVEADGIAIEEHIQRWVRVISDGNNT